MYKDYQANLASKVSQDTKVYQDCQDYQVQRETKGWVCLDNLVTKASQGPQDLQGQGGYLVLENQG